METVVDVPETRFTRTPAGLHIAYQVIGRGADLVLIPGWATHIEAMWDEPRFAAFLRRLSTFARLIVFDKRGVGLSDPLPGPGMPTLETWIDDVQSVMGAAGSDRAVLCAAAEAGPMAMLYAATHPERLSALVLVNTFATLRRSPDYPPGLPNWLRREILELFESTAGQGPVLLDLQAPSLTNDGDFQGWANRYQRLSASPGTLWGLSRMILDIDVRSVLPSIEVPTKVVHTAGDRYFRADHGRYLAGHIRNAVYVERQGEDHFFWLGDAEPLLNELAELLIGSRQAPHPERVLSTVVFTDIVGSTELASGSGDEEWTRVLDGHDRMVRRQLQRFRGCEVKNTGDGFLATFDGPARAIACACAIRDSARHLGVEVRIGIHTGEIELRGGDIRGIGVHIAARVEAAAGAGEVVVSASVPPLVAGSGISFSDLGEHQLKGIPDHWRLFEVTGSEGSRAPGVSA